MRGFVPSIEVRRPDSLREALALFAAEPGTWKPLAGGTDLMVLLDSGKLETRKFVDLQPYSELQGIREEKSHFRIGALTTFSQIRRHPVLRKEFGMLCEAAASVGAIAIQNRATIGGNICNASPAADSPPALLAYDAAVELLSEKGSRWLPYKDFHLGYKKTAAMPGEIISAVFLPRTQRTRTTFFRKIGTRKAQAISKVCFAGLAEVEKHRIRDIRIVFGSVGPTVLRLFKIEDLLRGQVPGSALVEHAVASFVSEIVPIDDIRSTAEYRREVSVNLLKEFLLKLE